MVIIQLVSLATLCIFCISASKKLDHHTSKTITEYGKFSLKDSILPPGSSKEWVDGWMKGWKEGFNFKKTGADQSLKMFGSSHTIYPILAPPSYEFKEASIPSTGERGRYDSSFKFKDLIIRGNGKYVIPSDDKSIHPNNGYSDRDPRSYDAPRVHKNVGEESQWNRQYVYGDYSSSQSSFNGKNNYFGS